jgi:hypothetical protein
MKIGGRVTLLLCIGGGGGGEGEGCFCKGGGEESSELGTGKKAHVLAVVTGLIYCFAEVGGKIK